MKTTRVTHFTEQLRNKLSVARTTPSTPASTGQLPALHSDAELTQRFSFRPGSDDGAEEVVQQPPRISPVRRALLDKRLLEAVYEQLAHQSHLETRELLLHVSNGVMSIEGWVSSRNMRAKIGNFIRQCPFVTHVINHVLIRNEDGALAA
ncbi:BON domain-containing protein [Uliginosibacterium sp. H3]|uniref:BON domain-containing protein n=1 Tax=Uliginosibacterium silvisoli TaxID=3114758 RepID=A0ABU6K824_9RHOO|nr:BON domain-containing protein [Uliginosibacterium sp. H3]